MDYKKLLKILGFEPKENTSGIFQKKYNGYSIEIDFENEIFDFGKKIKAESKTTQNFSQAENWVVLECVDRLLEKGYQPKNIILEKTWKTGHGTSGRLDILVTHNDGSAYLMIECKTWGTEFDKEFKNLTKNGGQLFTYFQQDKDADVIMLYTSALDGKEIKHRNEIVKIEEDYRQAGNVKDFFDRWNKLPKSNGIFDKWASPYEFKSKALTKNDLKILKQEDSSFIFNRFLEILRHNVVSDKPNAFNKIFTLFLCKIVDEYSKNVKEELEFQWLEGKDDHVSFQKRLTDLYGKGMRELLEKNVTDVSDEELDRRFKLVDEKYQEEFKSILTEIRLKKNNEFAIKEVFDDASFNENAKVVKEVVELLQVYQLRYNYRQQFLSDFFELLLTTGLKQESGQFFTPVPIARFIIKSLPLREIAAKKIEQGNKKDLLPMIIDYAAGSGHFLTESMEELQKYIDGLKPKNYKPETRKQLDGFQRVQFDWAEDYVYGIEKDYRLVKTAKVSCYLHGDGLAKIIHGDGLGDFATSPVYKDSLKKTDKTYPQDNKQFDMVISNPPYSVSAFKGLMDSQKSQKAFDLYKRLTDQSSEIECLFVERTKQLLKDGGVAGIILPSSILSNTGIYTQSREIILKYFDIIAITEMGSNTFMATGTNTVTLFLRRRNNADAINIKEAVKKCFSNLRDVTINGIEKPISKYISHVWEDISFDDYKTLLQKSPNEKIENHEIFQEYKKKIKTKNNEDLWDSVLELEQEKLLYFIIAYEQKIVVVKTGNKAEEKRFLGYEFSNRRGSEGIHPIQRSKSIDECTQLYDVQHYANPEKASTYIYKAFNNELDIELPENLQKNVSYHNLIDMLTFDRVDFDKNISLSAKKKIKFESKWSLVPLKNLAKINPSKSEISKLDNKLLASFIEMASISNKGKITKKEDRPLSDVKGSSYKTFKEHDILVAKITPCMENGKCAIASNLTNALGFGSSEFHVIRTKELLNNKYLFALINRDEIRKIAETNMTGTSGHRRVPASFYEGIKIPLPPLEIQKKIVNAIEKLEDQEQQAVEAAGKLLAKKEEIIDKRFNKIDLVVISSFSKVKGGKRVPKGYSFSIKKTNFPYIRVSDFRNGSVNSSNLKYIDEEIFTRIRNYTIGKNDIYISIAGTVGLVGIVPDILDGKSLTENAAKIIINDPANVSQKYVYYMLTSNNVKEQIKSRTKAVGVPKLALKRIDTIKIPLSSIAEQRKIITAIEKIEKQIASLEKKIANIPKQKENVLKKYLE